MTGDVAQVLNIANHVKGMSDLLKIIQNNVSVWNDKKTPEDYQNLQKQIKNYTTQLKSLIHAQLQNKQSNNQVLKDILKDFAESLNDITNFASTSEK